MEGLQPHDRISFRGLLVAVALVVLAYAGAAAAVMLVHGARGRPTAITFSWDAAPTNTSGELDALAHHYGLPPPTHRRNAGADRYVDLASGRTDVTLGAATDGALTIHRLTALADDREYFGSRLPSPVMTREILSRHPELKGLVGQLSGAIDDAAMRDLNARVMSGAADARTVAVQFCVAAGISVEGPGPRSNTSGIVRLGFGSSVEQRVLAEILAVAIESASEVDVVGVSDLGGDQDYLRSLIAGEIDLCILPAGSDPASPQCPPRAEATSPQRPINVRSCTPTSCGSLHSVSMPARH